MIEANKIQMCGDTFHEEGSSELYFSYRFFRKESGAMIEYIGWDSIAYNAIDLTPHRSIEEYIKQNAERLRNKALLNNRSAVMKKIYSFSEQQDTDYSEITQENIEELTTVDELTKEDISATKAEFKAFGLDFAYSMDLLCTFLKRGE